ncbi:hypothetical protein CW664_01705 [Macrococcoides caseolyticum]|uniref:hypothetical protein n=1 Tax=Macrococcoides caseolyticum TaxID=69966 RepID=UPI000C328561|nr:hypothetical protein [Macrococcus caseolyticus]PKF46484.1 hypothetical protein CW664_01705 [Macrococcus caseolyticus]
MNLYRVRQRDYEYDVILAIYVFAETAEDALSIARAGNKFQDMIDSYPEKRQLDFEKNKHYWDFEGESDLIVENLNLECNKVIAVHSTQI